MFVQQNGDIYTYKYALDIIWCAYDISENVRLLRYINKILQRVQTAPIIDKKTKASSSRLFVKSISA